MTVKDTKAGDIIAEDSVAAQTLSPSRETSKMEVIKDLIGIAAGLNGKDLFDFHAKVLGQVSREGDAISSGASAKNKATIATKPSAAGKGGPDVTDPMPKLSVKEDVAELFGSEELTEEFKEKAEILFEAALSARLIIETVRIEEEFGKLYDESIEELQTEMAENVNKYITFVAEEFIKENEVAIEHSLKAELFEEFMVGLKTLFQENYIQIPEDKLDVITALSDRVQELETKLNEQIEKEIDLNGELAVHQAEEVFQEVSEGLALTSIEKLRALSEGLDFDGDVETFRRKLVVVRENYFPSGKKVNTNIITEEALNEPEAIKEYVDPEMAFIHDAISRTAPSKQ